MVAKYRSNNLETQGTTSCEPLRRSPRFQGLLGEVCLVSILIYITTTLAYQFLYYNFYNDKRKTRFLIF